MMADTFLALLLAHLLGDYVAQTGWMVREKRRIEVLGLHVAVHLVALIVMLGGGWQVALGITAAHFAIDALKTHVLPEGLWSYVADQLAHLATLIVAAWFVPDLFAQGIWGPYADASRDWAIMAAGFILCTYTGGPAVGYLLTTYADPGIEPGLARAGRIIGLLERALIFLMVLSNQLAGIGFLIAAKSILRFDTASQNQKASEYVIIGTLASFGWALAVSFGTQTLLD